MKKFFGFGSSTPPPPPPPSKPPGPPTKTNMPAPAHTKSATNTPVPAQPSIVGRWKEASSRDTTEFHADGTVTEKTGEGQTIRGRYSLRDKQLKINLEGVPNELTFPVAVGANTLEMTDSEGKITHYQRIP